MKYQPRLHIVLYQPEIPYNTGSVGRTCVAVGAKLWLVRPLGFRIDDYYLRRAGLDYWEHLEWEAVDDWAALVARLNARIARQAAVVFHQNGDANLHERRVSARQMFSFSAANRTGCRHRYWKQSRANSADSDSPRSAELELIEQRGDCGLRGTAAVGQDAMRLAN